MKNHIKVNGRLLQANKKWSHLKQKQREWIYRITKEEYDRFIATHKKQPRKGGKDEVIETVYDRIKGKEIWIPFYETKAHIGKYIDRYNRKPHEVTAEDGEVITVAPIFKPGKPGKPKPPMINFTEASDKVKAIFYDKIKNTVSLYITQTAKLPPNKIRDGHLKVVLSGFNAKQYKLTGTKVLKDNSLLSVYDNICKELYAEYQVNGQLNVETKREKLNKSLTVLETERLILRKMHIGDTKEISAIISDIEVMYAWERAFPDKKDAHDWIVKQCRRYKHEQTGYFLAVDKTTGMVVGQIGLMWNEINGERTFEVGYILKKSYWHKGYATEGAAACLKYGFDLYDDVEKIVAAIRPENTASIAVAQRLGMKLIGEYDKEYEGKLMKHLIYGISRERME